MAWAIDHTVTVTIDGVDQSANVLSSSVYVRQQVGNEAGVASFNIWDNSGNLKPGGWDTVTIVVDGATVFGGFVTGVEVSAVDTQTGTRYSVECKDWSILFDTVTVNKSYGPYDNGSTMVDYTDKTIVANLFSTYLSGEGFDASTYVNAQKSAMEIGFENVSLRAALNALAVRAGADWFIDGSKNLWWFNPASPGAAAFSISSDSPDYSASYPPLRGSIRRSVDTLNVANRVIVLGGYLDTRTSETFTYRAGKSVYTVANTPLKSVIQVRANTTGAGPLPATSGSNRLGFAPQDSLVADGGEAWYLVDLQAGTVSIDATVTDYCSAGDAIAIDYVYLTQVTATASDAGSISTYGRTITRTFYNEELSSTTAAEEYAAQVLTENAYGRETVTLDVAEYGLLAGKLLTINVGEVDVGGTERLLLEQSGDRVLAQNDNNLITDESEISRTFLIQQVEYRPMVAGDDTFLMICSVTAGYYRSTLIEALTRLGNAAGLGSSSGLASAVRYPGTLGAIASDLGEVVAGRVVLTDGGTAPFDWDTYHKHTGVITGLDDSGTVPYGSFLLLEGGTVRAKIGRLDGLAGPGTHTPTGWGMWTTNGYFAGTVAGSYISGGTIVATAGSIGGWTVESHKLYTAGGTIQVGSAPSQVVNSANPGVRIDATGLYGYGTVGNTFALYTDGRPPYISSGTIKEMVFEAYTAGVFRTGSAVATDGGVQVDRSGIFAYSPTGVLKFQVDAATGLLTATDGYFSGTVSAAGGSVSINDDGIQLVQPAVWTDSNSVTWTTGGSVTGWVASLADASSGANMTYLYADTGNSKNGISRLYARHTSGSVSYVDTGQGTVTLNPWGGQLGAGTVWAFGTVFKVYADMTVGGHTYLNGHVGLGDGTADNIDFNGRLNQHLIPNSSLNLGDNTNRYNNIYGTAIHGTHGTISNITSSGTIFASGVIKSNTKLEGPAINLNGASSLVSGSGAPSSGLGANGDIYFDYTAGSANFMYRKQGGSWIQLVTT
jgi:hypothetical protein